MPPNILVIVLDAVRRDHVSCYEYERPTTSSIDRLAESGVKFNQAFANSNWTGTSHGAMFTGLLPSESGVYAGKQELPKGTKTLPERLHQAGYATFGMSAGAHIRRQRGYARGFEEFKETYRISPDRKFLTNLMQDPSLRRQTRFSVTCGPDKKTLFKIDSLRRWINQTQRPFFGFINLKTAHNPYNPPRPFKSEFCESLQRPRYQLIEELLGDKYGDKQSLPGMDFQRLQRLSNEFPVVTGTMEPTDREWDVLKSWYDGAIKYMDARVGELVDFLDETGKLKNTYIVLTADHGELFGEHGFEKHTYSLYEPVLRVPLVFVTPEDKNQVVREPVSLVDLYPTILEIADVSVSRDYATSLVPFEDREYHEYLFAELGRVAPDGIKRQHPEFDGTGFGEPMQVVRNNTYKLIAHENGERELYNWRNDFAEETDLSESKPETVSELQSVLEDELSPLTNESLNEDIEDEDLKDHLQDLGYM